MFCLLWHPKFQYLPHKSPSQLSWTLFHIFKSCSIIVDVRFGLTQTIKWLGYGLKGPGTRVTFLEGAQGLITLLHIAETGSGHRPACCPMVACCNREAGRCWLVLCSQATLPLLLTERGDIVGFPWSRDARHPTEDACFYATQKEIKLIEPHIRTLQNVRIWWMLNSGCTFCSKL